MSLLNLTLRLALVATIVMPIIGISLTPDIDREANWQSGWSDLATDSDGAGFLVWESNRAGGNWRIFSRDLDGGNLRQLTPDDGKQHFAPHIAPGGERIVYLAMDDGLNLYDKALGGTGTLRIIDADGDGARVIAPTARGYYEDRVALWIDDDNLFFIDGDGTTRRLTISTGETVELTQRTAEAWGWFPNRQMTHITAGWPSFPLFDPESKRILYRRHMPGCQPYFSSDGIWGFWTGGAGGPLSRFELATRKESPILTRHDERLPESRRYLYFPMLSACQTRFAFGASYYAHDHFTSDYEIFLARICPFTLELIGDPQRYTFDTACDRFPDVHLDRLELDKQRGMAPFEVDFAAALEGHGAGWRFDFDDPANTSSPVPDHRYESPGAYHVTAVRGGQRLRGYVRVDKRTGPVALDAKMTGERTLELRFDAPLAAPPTLGTAGATIRCEPELAVARTAQLGETANALVVHLDQTVRSPFAVSLGAAFVGRADRALPVVAEGVAVRMQSWPVDPLRLAFVFQHGDAENLAVDAKVGELVNFELDRHGGAWLDRRMALAPRTGTFTSPRGAANIVEIVRQHNAFSFEAVLEPDLPDQTGIIVELFGLHGTDFVLEQRGRRLVARVRTSPGDGPLLEIPLRRIRRNDHVGIGLSERVAVGRVNGDGRSFTVGLSNDFSTWRSDQLRIGDPNGGWRGTLHHIAIFGRDRSDFETVRDHELGERWIAAQPEVERHRMNGAKLIAKARIPTLARISPYREALSVFEYRSRRGRTVRVAHWVLLDGEATPESDRKIGTQHDLVLEPLAAHPEVQGRRIEEDGLPVNFDLELMFDPR